MSSNSDPLDCPASSHAYVPSKVVARLLQDKIRSVIVASSSISNNPCLVPLRVSNEKVIINPHPSSVHEKTISPAPVPMMIHVPRPVQSRSFASSYAAQRSSMISVNSEQVVMM